MRQKPAVMKNIKKTFFLSDSEVNHLLTAGIGEGILIMEDEHSEIKIVASKEEHKIITTNADELLASQEKITESQRLSKLQEHFDEQERDMKKRKKIRVKISTKQICHKLNDLNEVESTYLKSKGFREYKFQGILSKKKEIYIIRPRRSESPQHIFLIYDIELYIRKFTDKVWTYQTVKPDIIFKINGKEYAIEVETGKMMKYNKKDLRKKVETLNENYKDRWFFVVTDRNLKTGYAKWGRTYDKRHLTGVINRIVSKK